MDKDEWLDPLMESGLLQVPDDFTERVMQQVRLLPLPGRMSRWREQLQWLVLLGATTLGAMQLLGFVFGIWAATSAA